VNTHTPLKGLVTKTTEDLEIIKDEFDIADISPHITTKDDLTSKKLASLLRQKQRDQQEVKELRFKLDRE
jgi:hypothetical protein